MEFLLLILIIVLGVRWVFLSRRLKQLDQKIERVSKALGELSAGSATQEQPRRTRHADVPAEREAPAFVSWERAPAPTPRRGSAGAGTRAGGRTPQRGADTPSALTQWGERIRERMAGEEWEAVVGGSWLNKLGVLVLVIGLSLFVGYSFTRLGPPGRIAVGLAVSVAMLAGGAIFERRARYLIIGHGLIAGGWAGLYFTTYAAHGLEAARVIRDPLVGIALLAAVAAGIILHSLRYQSEVVTGLAYFLGFVTLSLSPVTGFTAAASVPLAGSLLYVAQRFSWTSMAVAGVVLTYATFALRLGAGAPVGGFLEDLVSRQSILATYWVLFEGFDLLNLLKRRQKRGIAQTIFPLNACGFLGVSLLQWPSGTPKALSFFFAAAGAAYLANAILRARLEPPARPADESAILERALGGYKGAVTLAVALLIPGIFLRFAGLTINVALLLEAELLFLAGLRLGQPYLRTLAALVFAFPLGKLWIFDFDQLQSQRLDVLGMSLLAVTPVALLMVAVLYLNRALIKPDRESVLLFPELGYSYIASTLLAGVLGLEMAPGHLGLAWLLLAVCLLEFGLRTTLHEFLFQAYGVGLLSLGALLIINVLGIGGQTLREPWAPLAAAALAAYTIAARLFWLKADWLPIREHLGIRHVTSTAGAGLLTALLWYVLPTPLVAIGWGLLALLFIEVGLSLRLPSLRVHGHLVAALACGRLFLANFTNMGETAGISHRLLTVLPLIVLFYYVRLRHGAGERRESTQAWEHSVSRLYLYAASVLVIVLLRFEMGRVLAVVGWALFGLALLIAGRRWGSPDLRWQSYGVALLTFVRSWATNFYIPESLAGLSGRLVAGGVVIACLYAGQLLSPRPTGESRSARGSLLRRSLVQFDDNARTILSILATTLFSVLVFYEVSGRLLTVAWGLQGVGLLVAGFPLRERILRLSGLLLLAVCILKVFAYDLSQLEALPRILSFVALGVLLLGASFIYTRFREQLRRYL